MARSKRVQLDDDLPPEATTRPSRNKRQRGTDVEVISRTPLLLAATSSKGTAAGHNQPNLKQDQTKYDNTVEEEADITWQSDCKPGKVSPVLVYRVIPLSVLSTVTKRLLARMATETRRLYRIPLQRVFSSPQVSLLQLHNA